MSYSYDYFRLYYLHTVSLACGLPSAYINIDTYDRIEETNDKETEETEEKEENIYDLGGES